MDNHDRERIEKMVLDRKLARTYYLGHSKMYQQFLDMVETTYSDGELSRKHKELIAVGISIVIHCEPCLEWHIKQALDLGATEKEIIEAIEVGMEMGGGPATAASRFAMKVLEYYTEKP